MLTFFVMTTMISDFSSVLLDIRDSNIHYPKPIDRQTISAAKLIHIIIYLSRLTGALVGPSLIAGLIINGILFFACGSDECDINRYVSRCDNGTNLHIDLEIF